jgi:hypothetical protein
MAQCKYPGSYLTDGIETTNADTQLYVDLGPEYTPPDDIIDHIKKMIDEQEFVVRGKRDNRLDTRESFVKHNRRKPKLPWVHILNDKLPKLGWVLTRRYSRSLRGNEPSLHESKGGSVVPTTTK